jgi:transposase-like protein
MGLSSSEEELESVAQSFVEELQLRNSRSLDPDLLALFVDGKYIEWREGDKLRPATIYVVVGLGRDGKKRVLACLPQAGRETVEGWKVVLRSLCERGLRRVMLIVQDDFTGLLPVCQSPVSPSRRPTLHRSHAAQCEKPPVQSRLDGLSEALARH